MAQLSTPKTRDPLSFWARSDAAPITTKELDAFIALANFVQRSLVIFWLATRHPQKFSADELQAWSQVFQQPASYPPLVGHPLAPKPQALTLADHHLINLRHEFSEARLEPMAIRSTASCATARSPSRWPRRLKSCGTRKVSLSLPGLTGQSSNRYAAVLGLAVVTGYPPSRA
jgi:hypothetical protein